MTTKDVLDSINVDFILLGGDTRYGIRDLGAKTNGMWEKKMKLNEIRDMGLFKNINTQKSGSSDPLPPLITLSYDLRNPLPPFLTRMK